MIEKSSKSYENEREKVDQLSDDSIFQISNLQNINKDLTEQLKSDEGESNERINDFMKIKDEFSGLQKENLELKTD